MTHHQIFDRLLNQIVAGQATEAVLHLAAMLDAALVEQSTFAAFKRKLRAHSLHSLFQQDAVTKAGSTGKHLSAAVAQLAVMRALHLHHARLNDMLRRAWRSGKRVAILGCDNPMRMRVSPGQDVSNIEEYGWHQFFDASACRFDLILIPLMSDLFGHDALQKLFRHLPERLVEDGRAHLTIRAPHHLGSGWCEAFLGMTPPIDDEFSLARAAEDYGLGIKSYRDATDCLIWSEVRLLQNIMDGGESAWTVALH